MTKTRTSSPHLIRIETDESTCSGPTGDDTYKRRKIVTKRTTREKSATRTRSGTGNMSAMKQFRVASSNDSTVGTEDISPQSFPLELPTLRQRQQQHQHQQQLILRRTQWKPCRMRRRQYTTSTLSSCPNQRKHYRFVVVPRFMITPQLLMVLFIIGTNFFTSTTIRTVSTITRSLTPFSSSSSSSSSSSFCAIVFVGATSVDSDSTAIPSNTDDDHSLELEREAITSIEDGGREAAEAADTTAAATTLATEDNDGGDMTTTEITTTGLDGEIISKTINLSPEELAALLGQANGINSGGGAGERSAQHHFNQLDQLLSQQLSRRSGTSSTTSATTTTMTTSSGSINGNGGGSNLFKSIWKTFKEKFEHNVQTRSSSRLDRHHQQQTNQQQHQHQSTHHATHGRNSNNNHNNNNKHGNVQQHLRRTHLLRKSLHENYIQQFVDSVPLRIRNALERFIARSDDHQNHYHHNDDLESNEQSRPSTGAATSMLSRLLKQNQHHQQQSGKNRLQPYRWKKFISTATTPATTTDIRDDAPSSSASQQSQPTSYLCHYYWESRNSFWSFEWCPQRREFVQGQSNIDHTTTENSGRPLNHDNPTFTRRFSLGTWVGLESEIDMSQLYRTHPDAVRFWLVMRETHRKRTAETLPSTHTSESTTTRADLYVDGDPCFSEDSVSSSQEHVTQKKRNQKRMSVVIYHDQSDDICTTSPQPATDTTTGTQTTGDFTIEKVDEPYVCQYVVHVCQLPLKNASNFNEQNEEADEQSPRNESITETKLQQLNETYHLLHDVVLQTFLGQSHADTQHQMSPTILTSFRTGLPPMPQSRIESNKRQVKKMFLHAYDNYMYNAYPASEIKPITCSPTQFNLVRIPALTLIDSLDTLIVLGNFTEFARSVERIRLLNDRIAEEATSSILMGVEHVENAGLFSLDQNVSVFETNIRILGGLLSAHQLAEAFMNKKVLDRDVWVDKDRKMVLSGRRKRQDDDHTILDHDSYTEKNGTAPILAYWEYDGLFLQMSQNIGDRLKQAFETNTGIPYGTVNLLTGVPEGETPVASLAGGGTLTLEMELLSRLTGNPEYGRAAKLATRALWMRRSPQGLLGKHISTSTGDWTETLSGIGSNSDSFYEYLIKHHVVFPEDSDFWLQMIAAHGGVFNESRAGEWYGDVDMNRGSQNGGGLRYVFESLMAFYPGLEVLLGEITPAARTLNSFFLVREHLGFLPERFNYGNWRVDTNGGAHLLRPELLESAYFLHRSSFDLQRSKPGQHGEDLETSGWQWAADFALHALEEQTRVNCGYASIRDVSPLTTGLLYDSTSKRQKLLNEMPSYFLSETLKYLYLMFDEENMLHTDESRDWIFTTEAHPIHHESENEEVDIYPEVSRLQKQKERLIARLQMRASGISDRRNLASIDESSLGQREHWSALTSFDDYKTQLQSIKLDDKRYFELRNLDHSTEPLISYISPTIDLDILSERTLQSNPSHKTLRVMGNEARLSRSCENIYSPELLWYRALHGGGTDYTSSFLSRLHDTVSMTEGQALLLGSIDALALYGSGLHVEDLFNVDTGCPARARSAGRDGQTSQTTTQTSATKNSQDGTVHHINMGDGMGNFEISPFPGGGGFMVQHVESEESMVTTLIENSNDESWILVYANRGDNHDVDNSQEEVWDDSRVAIMADLRGNTFVCKVELLASGIDHSTSDREENVCINDSIENEKESFSDDSVEILASFPCSMGLFGATSPSHLNNMDSLSVVAPILSLDSETNHGCPSKHQRHTSEEIESIDSPESDDDGSAAIDVCRPKEKNVVSIVHRGVCTFEEKSMAQKVESGASAVVVINSSEDELFVMAGGSAAASAEGIPPDEEYPPTVLVSGSDGQNILDIIEESTEYSNIQLHARVSVIREKTEVIQSDDVDGGGVYQVVGNTFWPGVRASPESLQIFSENGWGVHAVQTQTPSSGKGDTRLEWQLFLTKHDMTSRSATEEGTD